MTDTENLSEEPNTVEEAPKERLHLDVDVAQRGTCERHITVSIAREDIERYYDREFSELMPTAQVPGFRPGRAPRKLVENRFRKDVTGRVKSALLIDSLEQIHEEQKLTAIGEPDIDLDAVEVPDEGPLTFEFDLEVRPEFDLPQWKGLKLEKPVREFSDEDVDRTLRDILARRGRLVPTDGPAEPGDYISTNLTFKHGDRVLASATEEVIRLRSVLSFRDGRIEQFEQSMAGVKAGEQRLLKATISDDAPNAELRGQQVDAIFDVLEVKKLETPALTPELLQDLGRFESEADLRDAIRDQLQRQLDYQQRRRAREQVTAALTASANWELPHDLLHRQAHRELQRAVMELQRSGFSENEIRAHENELRQNSLRTTARALKEHFVLERIAEDEQIDAGDEDYEAEIRLIAEQTDESPRRVRARLEKAGAMDALRNQIIERKVIDQIIEHATFVEVPYDFGPSDTEALDEQISGVHGEDIPEAKPGPAEPAEGHGHGQPPHRHE